MCPTYFRFREHRKLVKEEITVWNRRFLFLTFIRAQMLTLNFCCLFIYLSLNIYFFRFFKRMTCTEQSFLDPTTPPPQCIHIHRLVKNKACMTHDDPWPSLQFMTFEKYFSYILFYRRVPVTAQSMEGQGRKSQSFSQPLLSLPHSVFCPLPALPLILEVSSLEIICSLLYVFC